MKSKNVVLIADGVGRNDLGFITPMAQELGIELISMDGYSASDLPRLASRAHGLVVKRTVVSDLLLSSCPNLRLVYKLGTLCDQIDMDATRVRGVTVNTIPLPSAIAVAEHTFCLILAVARHLLAGHQSVLRGQIQAGMVPQKTTESSYSYNWAGLPPSMQLNGKVLGLIGMGEIGIQIATRATAFGMNLLYHRRSRLNDDLEKNFGLSYRPIVEEVISEADIISLHVPHTPETDKLLNSERLRRLKPSAILINTARGGIVDETALVDMLATGRLAGAGLDVYEYEPLPPDSNLLKLNNVVLTPHSAGAGLEPFRQTLLKMINDIAFTLDAIK